MPTASRWSGSRVVARAAAWMRAARGRSEPAEDHQSSPGCGTRELSLDRGRARRALAIPLSANRVMGGALSAGAQAERTQAAADGGVRASEQFRQRARIQGVMQPQQLFLLVRPAAGALRRWCRRGRVDPEPCGAAAYRLWGAPQPLCGVLQRGPTGSQMRQAQVVLAAPAAGVSCQTELAERGRPR